MCRATPDRRRMIFAELGVDTRGHGISTAVKSEIAAPTDRADDQGIATGDKTALADAEDLGGVQAHDRGSFTHLQ